MSFTSPLAEIQNQINPELARLNRLMSESLHSDNDMMNRIVEGYLKAKGKQIRPILVILSAKMLGEVNDKVLEAAAAVEMLHNASLIHDDVIDESKMRHSRPTINSVWDNHIAVLVGDFFVSTALSKAIATGDLRIVNSISKLGKLLSLGEIDQIYNARYHSINEKAYFGIIYRKTASLFASCVEMGAFSLDIEDERLDILRRFAELLGLCFQIKDDIFDYYSDDTIGKPTGNDLREGKITLPLIYALSLTDHPRHSEMVALSRKEEVLTDEEIGRLIEFAKEAGGIDYACQRMKQLRDEAVETISTLEDPSGVGQMFIDLIDFIVHRDS